MQAGWPGWSGMQKMGKVNPGKSLQISPQRLRLNGVIIRLILELQSKLELFG